jgi:hypothetical protein
MKTRGVSVNGRKSHVAVTYKGSMLVYGGTSENGQIYSEMLAYHFDDQEWIKVKYGGISTPFFAQGAGCTVMPLKANDLSARKVSFNIFTSKSLFRVIWSRRAFTFLEVKFKMVSTRTSFGTLDQPRLIAEWSLESGSNLR